MAKIKLDIVTVEQQTISDEVDIVVAPGMEGQLAILPNHAPLVTMLESGEILFRKDGEETFLAISGGYLEVRPDKVIVLADSCERCEAIDIERAEEAKKRAEERLKAPLPAVDHARAEAALRRSIARLQVASKVRRRARPPL